MTIFNRPIPNRELERAGEKLRDLETRIGNLERRSSGGPDLNTVLYDSLDHYGSWVTIYTNNADDSDGNGILLQNVGGYGITIQNAGEDGTKILDSGGDGITLTASGGGDISINTADDMFLGADNVGVTIFASTGSEFFLVKDHGGNQLFRVNSDGTVHIKTGTSIIADL